MKDASEKRYQAVLGDEVDESRRKEYEVEMASSDG